MRDGLLEDTVPNHRGRIRVSRWTSGTVGQHSLVFLIYLAASLLLFGAPILRDPIHTYLGIGLENVHTGYTDPSFYMWNFVWWPHAIVHGLNPLVSHIAWAPDGFSLAAAQTSPVLSLVMSPITLALGPLAAYNVVMLLAPVLGAWTAYLLCRRVTGALWPSIAGGYFFGFSSYELGHLTDHPNLALTFLVPVAVYLVIRRLDGSLERRRFVAFLTILLILQFSISPEIFLTLAFFGLVVGGIASWMYRRQHEGRMPEALPGLVLGIALAYGLTVLFVAPYLAYMIGHGLPRLPASWPFVYTTDVANIVVPTRLHRFGGGLMGTVSDRFRAPIDESGAYIGPLVLIPALFVLRRSRTLLHRVLIWSLGAITLASMGPTLTAAGTRIVALPWSIFAVLPIVKLALPARFSLYALLILSIIIALWLASTGKGRTTRWAVVIASAVLLLPNTSLPFWRNTPPVPSFFSSGVYRQYLGPGENTLIVPYGGISFSMLWQATSEMWFSMPEGRLCPMPRDFQTWPIVLTFQGGPLTASAEQDLAQFLAAKNVRKIVVVRGTSGPWLRLFSTLGVEPRQVADVTVYEVPSRIARTRPDISAPRPVLKELRDKCG
jgi:hypothetical protein